MSIEASLTIEELALLVKRQLNNYFPDSYVVSQSILEAAVKRCLPRLEYCFSHVNNKYFFNGKTVVFDHLHGDQYAMWLYFLSNELFRMEVESSLSKKIFLLNKALHGCDIYYEIELPEIFLLVHPLGTVLGRGEYKDYFIAYQRCGVGSNHDLYPKLGKFFTLRPGSSVLGNCVVKDNCSLAAGSLLLDADLGENSLYIGNPKNFMIKPQDDILSVWHV